MKLFVIQKNNDTNLLWDDEYGWTDIHHATIFWNDIFKENYTLPENGKFREMNTDEIYQSLEKDYVF
jgi:hypothetical protein